MPSFARSAWSRASRSRRASTWVLCSALAGCMSVPDDIQASMSPPDGRRPNNYGKTVAVASWRGDDGRNAQPDSQPFDVVPDRPTIAPVVSAGGGQ